MQQKLKIICIYQIFFVTLQPQAMQSPFRVDFVQR